MSWTKEEAIKYKNNFIKEKYDRVNLTMPKGRKAQATAHAQSLGKSLNSYINDLISADMGDKLTRPGKEPEQEQGE